MFLGANLCSKWLNLSRSTQQTVFTTYNTTLLKSRLQRIYVFQCFKLTLAGTSLSLPLCRINPL